MPPKKRVVKKPVKKPPVKKPPVKKPPVKKQPINHIGLIRDIKHTVTINNNKEEVKPKRKYTRRKAPTPTVQPIQLPQQPQQFQPNAQVQLNDLKQQLREREKEIKKELDEKLKNEQQNTEQEIMQRLGIRNKSEMNNANDFFGRLNEPQPPPETATAISTSDWLKKEQLKREEAQKEIAKLKANKAGTEASLLAKEKERQRKAQQTRADNAKKREESIINDILKYKNKSPDELKKLELFKNVKRIKTATDSKQILTQYIHQRYGGTLEKAKDYTSKH